MIKKLTKLSVFVLLLITAAATADAVNRMPPIPPLIIPPQIDNAEPQRQRSAEQRNIPASEVRTVHGDRARDSERWVLTILGDGFTAGQQNTFFDFAEWWAQEFLKLTPFNDYKDMINIHAIFVASASSDFGSGWQVAGNTYFQGFFFNNNRQCYFTSEGYARADALIGRDVPHNNQAVLFLNSTRWAGGGGGIPVSTMSRLAGAGLQAHEFGHSPRFSFLADEYDWVDMHANAGNPLGNEFFANRTAWSNQNNPKWSALLGIDGVVVDRFGGGGTNWARPHRNCMMRETDKDFCHVCAAAISRAIAVGAGPERQHQQGPAKGTGWSFFGGDRRELEREHGGAGLPNAPTSITMPMPAGVNRMLNYAFWGHTRVQTVILPNGLVNIGQFAFVGCSALETVEIPASITEIPLNAFHGLTRGNITIRGTNGSAAHTFATTNGFKWESTGGGTSITNLERSNNRYGIKFAINPVSEQAEISVVLPDASTGSATEVGVVIYDMVGNVVFEEKATNRTPVCRVIWDLRNPAGRFVANGTYLVVVEAKNINGRIYRYSARLGVNR